jgi:hypothetical protein
MLAALSSVSHSRNCPKSKLSKHQNWLAGCHSFRLTSIDRLWSKVKSNKSKPYEAEFSIEHTERGLKICKLFQKQTSHEFIAYRTFEGESSWVKPNSSLSNWIQSSSVQPKSTEPDQAQPKQTKSNQAKLNPLEITANKSTLVLPDLNESDSVVLKTPPFAPV